ncbi:MAG: protein phosphatase CheZ [Sulfuricella sp.]|nr:protein phosphatase CheZ [Sulfuricella sp.]
MSNENGDSDELEALFDSIVAASNTDEDEVVDAEVVQEVRKPGFPAGVAGEEETVFNQIGHLTRKLHDALRELGYDKKLEKTVESIPDTRDRLEYIAKMTEKAAVRALTATEIAQPIQEKLEADAAKLSQQWQRVFDNQMGVEEFKALAAQTKDFLGDVPNRAKATNAQLMEIMMAQDFQDLTGQVIKKVVDMAQRMEHDMLQLLIAVTPGDKKAEVDNSLLNGPVINPEGRADVVTSQKQVDDLLESLGF